MMHEQYSELVIQAPDFWQQKINGYSPGITSGVSYFLPYEHEKVQNTSFCLGLNEFIAKTSASSQTDTIIAIGPVYYFDKDGLQIFDDHDLGSSGDIELLARQLAPYFTYQLPLPGIEKNINKIFLNDLDNYDFGLLCFVDFDCKATGENKQKIIEVLLRLYQKSEDFGGWYLFESGGGFHLFLEKEGYSVPQLIQVYGQLIDVFAAETTGNRSHIYKYFARELSEGAELMDIPDGNVMMKNISRIKKACSEMLAIVGQKDEPEEGRLNFMIDLWHVAYMVLDLLKFNNGEKDAFGGLRITSEKKYGSPPILVAEFDDAQELLTHYPSMNRNIYQLSFSNL